MTNSCGFFNADPIVLIPGSGYSPSGLFIYNNVLYPAGNPLLDIDGLLFQDTATNAELNIWGVGPQSPYSTYTGSAGGYPHQDTTSVFQLAEFQLAESQLTQTTEPAPFALLGAGLACLMMGWTPRRRSRH